MRKNEETMGKTDRGGRTDSGCGNRSRNDFESRRSGNVWKIREGVFTELKYPGTGTDKNKRSSEHGGNTGAEGIV